VVVRYAARVNGLTGLAVTKMDVLDTIPELKIAVRYRAEGQDMDDFPADLGLLAAAEPEYETLEGWQTPTGHARRWEDLPPQAHAYLRRIEELTGVPIRFVSVGTRRDQIIHVER
jgi:adenylosuccinate synthase